MVIGGIRESLLVSMAIRVTKAITKVVYVMVIAEEKHYVK